MRYTFILPLLGLLSGAAACDDPAGPADVTSIDQPMALPVLGRGIVPARFTSELWVHNGVGYTGTWHNPTEQGSVMYVWDMERNTPQLLDSVVVQGVETFGDIQVSDDGRLLVVAAEHYPEGSIFIYDLANPRKPRLITRHLTENTRPGVHTAEVARVGGTLYAFLSVDPARGRPSRLLTVDLSDPANPREVSSVIMGRPVVHDVFVRDGWLFTANWDEGLVIWDIGARGGSPANPVRISSVETVGGNVHNVWWVYDQLTGSKRYVLVGEEQSAGEGSSAGDIHVVDVSDITQPKEVAFFHIPESQMEGRTVTYGTHNFSVDERRGILYAAYYNGGVRALNLRGDLGTCAAEHRDASGRCDLWAEGREVGRALSDQGARIWGVFQAGSVLYASDMSSGLWKLDTAPLLRALRR